MTREEILTMESGYEMDALIAEAILGWKHITLDTPYPQCGCLMEGIALKVSARLIPRQWQPSTDLNDAWEVAEKFEFTMMRDINEDGKAEYCVWIGAENTERWVSADTAPLAICRAALLTTIEEKENHGK